MSYFVIITVGNIINNHLNSTPLQAGGGPDLEAVCYATNEVLGADSVATCPHKKDIKSVTKLL